MKNSLLLAVFFLFFNSSLFGQADSLPPLPEAENVATAGLKTKEILIDMANPEDVDLALKKIHTFKYLESVILDGETDENTLTKLFYRLSVIKNLTKLTLRETELTKVPDNISNLKTLQSLTVEDNVNLDYNHLFLRLKSIPLVQLVLIDNDLKSVPASLSGLSSLKKIQLSGSNQLDYAGFVDQLSLLPNLTVLSIAVNYITELPKNLDKLKSLQTLDVSNNNLTELPGAISTLKAINNLSIQGNLLIDPAADLEKLKGNNIQYLSLDKEVSGEELEKIKKMFPAAQIDFPISKEEKEAEEDRKAAEKAVEEKPVYKGELKVKKEAAILSGAYLLYPTLFQGVTYNFDTLGFEERYKDLLYENVIQKASQSWRGATVYFRKQLMYFEKPGKKSETWFRFSADQNTYLNYPELRAFSGMYWVYKGPLTKKQFAKTYLVRKQKPEGVNWFGGEKRRKRKQVILWNDIRIDFDKNNSLFKIQVKTDTGFAEFKAYPVVQYVPLEKSQQTYNRRFLMYEKGLQRRSQRFRRNQATSKARYDLNFRNMKSYCWKELQLRMSNEEKVMSQEEWLDYYDAIIANEQKAIDNTALLPLFISRGLMLRGYTATNGTDPMGVALTEALKPNYAVRTVNVDFVDAKGAGKLAVANIIILDNKNKSMVRIPGTLGLMPNPLTLRQFSSYSILVEMRNGNWGIVNSDEIDSYTLDPSKIYQFNTKVLDKNLDTIGDLLNNGTK